MKLSFLSKYRTLLMGVAILWVMFYHSRIDVGTSVFLEFIKRIGYGGVDIFILVSGFGVYFSISKDSSVKHFYKKRALRIFPYYLPIVFLVTIIANLMGIWTLKAFFYNLTTLGFWFNAGLKNIFDWYIPALLLLYLVTPLFYKFFKKNKIVTCLVIIIGVYIINYTTGSSLWYLYNFTFRIPLYVIGFWLADFLSKNREYKFNNFSVGVLLVSLIAGLSILYYFYFYTDDFTMYGIYLVPFLLITLPLCLFLGYFFSLFKSYKFPILSFFGTHSLTLYIFHEKILYVCNLILPPYIKDIVAFVIAIIIAYLWQKIVDTVLAKYTQNKSIV